MGTLVKEVQGRSYLTQGVLLLVSAPDATAESVRGPVELVLPGLLPVLRTGTSEVIGYGQVEKTPSRLRVKLFLDYSTPERLELETGARKYLVLVHRTVPDLAGWVPTQHLELATTAPDDERVLPVGSPETFLF